MFLGAFHVFIDFLQATAAWTGSAELYGVVRDMAAGEDQEPEMPAVKVPIIPADEECAALAALPLLERAQALLGWLGDERAVTATGVLRLRDIEAAAASVGEAARGSQKLPPIAPGVLPAGIGGSQPDAETAIVRSMHEVPLLSQLWRTLDVAGAIEIRSTKAVPGGAARAIAADDAEAAERLPSLRRLVSVYLYESITVLPPFGPNLWHEPATDIVVAVLLAGAAGAPVSLERFEQAADLPPGHATSTNALALRLAYGLLRRLAVLGLVELDTHIRVPEPLVRCVADAFGGETDFEIVYPEDGPAAGRP